MLDLAAQAARGPIRNLVLRSLALLPGVLEAAPSDALQCVFHACTLNQFRPEARHALDDLLTRASKKRPLCRIGQEGLRGVGHAVIELEAMQAGERSLTLLAHCDAHASWLEWLGLVACCVVARYNLGRSR